MSGKWKFRYGSTAILVAAAIITMSLLVNPSMLPGTANAATFAVLLTDPPTVPAGTTVLNLTYTDVLLHVTYSDDTTEWIELGASGTVNLFSLINMSQTIATTTIPVGSTVDKIQFNIGEVIAEVNGQIFDVTALSNEFVVKVLNGYIDESLSGVLLDFNPTLVQIQARDANDNLVNYYVLVPSASAVVIDDLEDGQAKVGTIIKISEKNKVKLFNVKEDFKNNVKIVNAELTVDGNETTLSVDLKNEGSFAFRAFGLTLNGEFNTTKITNESKSEEDDEEDEYEVEKEVHPRTIPFKLSGQSLIPVFNQRDRDDKDMDTKGFDSFTLQPGETATLTFSGVIQLQPDKDDDKKRSTVIIPLPGYDYELKLLGEGFQKVSIQATQSDGL